MDTLSSAEFRKQYAKLSKPTVVTVNGHAIGVWEPVNILPPADDASAGTVSLEADITTSDAAVIAVVQHERASPTMTQADRDAILRRVQRG